MDINNWIMIVSALIITVGWFVTGHLERKNEITKERRSYRLDMLLSFFQVIFFIEKNLNMHTKQQIEELTKLVEESRRKFLLYGYVDEIDAYENVVDALLGKNNDSKIQKLNILSAIVRKRIRTELDLPFHVLRRA
jgi:hypothetical protein